MSACEIIPFTTEAGKNRFMGLFMGTDAEGNNDPIMGPFTGKVKGYINRWERTIFNPDENDSRWRVCLMPLAGNLNNPGEIAQDRAAFHWFPGWIKSKDPSRQLKANSNLTIISRLT